MKKFLVVISLYLVARHVSALPTFEPFADATANGGTAYTVGTALTNNYLTPLNAWITLGAVNGANTPEPTIVAGNLTYAGLPPSTGNSVTFYSVAGKGARLNLGGTANKAYYSYILKITDISNVPTTANNNYFAAFSDGTAAQPNRLGRAGTRVLVKKSGTNYVLGVSKTQNTADMVYDTTLFSLNDVLFLVGSFEASGGVTNCSLWINPPVSTFGSNLPPAPTLTATLDSDATTPSALTAGVAAFAINCQSASAPVGILDELRVGTNWTYVTGGDPAILSVPTNLVVTPGSTASFRVAARGTPTLTYGWVKDNTTILSNGGNISGATTTNLIISNVSPADAGAYSMFVTNGLGSSVQSSSATLSISDPAIIGQPQDRTNNFGTTATFQVTALGTAPFSYQWHKAGTGDLSDGGNISGSHTNVLTVSGVSGSDAGIYSVTVTNSHGSVDSSNALLTVVDPIITTQPASVTNVAGANVTFNVVAAGTGSFTYQWYKNGSPLSDTGNISGSATDTLGVSGISLSDDADYNVVVTGVSSTASLPAHLTVETPVAITVQPVPRTVPPGASTILAVGATGYAPLLYQWQHEGTNVPGANSAAYTILNLQPALTGNYRVIVSNVLNAVTSSVAAVAIANSLHFYSSNLAVVRVGNGAQALTANGNSMFMDQFTSNGAYVCTINIPDTGTNAMITLGPTIVSSPASSVTGTTLSRSLDGRQLVIAAYNTAVGFGSTLNTSSSASVPRAVGFINANGQYTLALATTDTTFSGTFFRSAVSDGVNNFWGAGRNPGTFYFGFGASAAMIQSVFSNMRSMSLFNGSIYCVSAVPALNGVLKLDGMPQTAAAANPNQLISGSGTASSDLEVSPDGNLIYLADSRPSPDGGIQRWQFDTNSSTWSLAYTLTSGLPNGAYYVTADFSGANPVVYAVTTEDSNNQLVQITDMGAASPGTTFAYAGVNQNFRGIRLGPSESPPILSITPNGNNVVLQWSGAFVLQSATNVTGQYSDVIPTATSPYTNATGGGGQRFFRLRN